VTAHAAAQHKTKPKAKPYTLAKVLRIACATQILSTTLPGCDTDTDSTTQVMQAKVPKNTAALSAKYY
jgi:hypothetical protein